MSALYVQVIITIALTVIPGRSYMLLADIKQQKLNTRLNLIRYVSHEMRTPLNTAFLGLEMLTTDLNTMKTKFSAVLNQLENVSNVRKRTSQDLAGDVHELQDTVKQVQDSCKVAVETLDDLLTFDKLDESKLVIEVNDLNPWLFLSDAAKPFEINAKQLDVNFSVAIQDDNETWLNDHFIKGDKFKLAQVVRNLCSNALKFTPPMGYVDVRLALVPPQESKLGRDLGPAVRISVKDTGAGISPENQKRLFGQYVQFNASKLQQGKGSGLGLWISKSIVEMHGGKIWAHSEGEGKGTTFGIDLPVFHRESEGGNLGALLSVITMRRPGAGANGLTSGRPRMPSRQSSKLEIGSTKAVDYRAAIATNNEPTSLNISLLNHDVVLKEGGTTSRVSVSAPDSSSSVADSSEHRRGSSVVAGLRRNGSGISPAALNPAVSTSTAPMLPLHQQLHQQIVQQIRATHNASGKGTAAEIATSTQPEPVEDSLSRVAEELSTDIPTRNGSWTQRMVSMVLPTRAVQINLSTRSSSSSGSNSANNSATYIVGVGHNKVRPSPPPEGEANDPSVGNIARHLQSDYDLENQQSVHPHSDPSDSALGLFRFSGKTGNAAPAVVRDGQSITLSTVMKSSVDTADKPVEAASTPVDAELSVFQPPSWERGLTILIVDDTPTNRKMLKKLLTSAGHKVFEAVDGVDCLEQLDFRRDDQFQTKKHVILRLVALRLFSPSL
eukprot:gene15717-11246_t